MSGLLSYAGYVLAAPNLQAIVDGEETDPIPSILEDALGTAGSKVLLLVTITARDRMLPASGWLSRMSARHAVPTNALFVACLVPVVICLYVYWRPDTLARVTAFAVLGIYLTFQAVVLAALRQRLRGWRPAGAWNLRRWGIVVNIAALAYGIFAIILLAKPVEADSFLDRWIVVIGAALVLVTGLAYMLIAKPYNNSEGIPEGDAVEVAEQLRRLHA